MATRSPKTPRNSATIDSSTGHPRGIQPEDLGQVFDVDPNLYLDEFHLVLQTVMGWEGLPPAFVREP